MPLDRTRIRAICFDVDGTLADTDDYVIQRLSRLIRPLHFAFPDCDPTRFLRRFVMASETPANFLFSLPDVVGLDRPLAALTDSLQKKSRGVGYPGHFLIIPGVRDMLDRLCERYLLAIVTARNGRDTRAFLDQFDLHPFFRCVAHAHTVRRTKPHPMPVLWAAGQLGVIPESVLMVGDTTVDIVAGHRAGAQTVGVLCGFGERRELERKGADLILDSTAELADVLLSDT